MDNLTHTRRLADLLSMECMGPSELKQAIEHKIPRELAYNLDGKTENARELLQMEGIAASGLIPTEVLATVLEGAEPLKAWRNAIPTYRMASAIMKVPYGESGSYLTPTAEGAEIAIENETYSVATLTAKKYAVRPMITREMVADATFDVVAQEIRKAGAKIENTLNRLVLDTVFASGAADAGTYQTDCGGSGATPLAFLAKALGTVQNRGFMPTDIMFNPVCYGACLSAFTSLATNGGNQATSTGTFGPLFGLNTHVCGAADNTTTYVWGFATNGDFGAIVYDRNSFAVIGEREPIGVEQFSDPIRDLVGMKVSTRIDAAQVLVTAGQYLQY
jgi:hypothetical protein